MRWLVLSMALAALSAQASSVDASDASAVSLGDHVHYLVEEAQPMSLDQAMAAHRAQRFQVSQTPVLNFGIGSRPIWLHVEVRNAGDSPASKYLVGGVTWLDVLDVYVVNQGQVVSHVRTGDRTPDAQDMVPAIGYALPLQFAPGSSDVFVRVQSVDPMVLPIELMSEKQLEARKRGATYGYGFVYGFLAALCIYNLLLFTGLGERTHLYYSLALLIFIVCNLGYTGHGLAYFWPGQLGFQNYVILVSMLLYSVIAWVFASRFLDLPEHAPRVNRTLQWASIGGLVLMLAAVLMQDHLLAARLAFVFMGSSVFVTFLLGILAVRQGHAAGRYFLAATFSGALGLAMTVFAVWGKIPFTPLTFHAVELGFIVEATLLALALAYQMRVYQRESRHAQDLARLDPLTGLHNRRAFLEAAQTWSSAAKRGKRPLSLIMMDIDHFKQINDRHGHQTGDNVLLAIADLLKKHGRSSDVLARWGGEEFMLLLTETDLNQATSYAQRLRQAIAEIRVPTQGGIVSLTASFGVTEHPSEQPLLESLNVADTLLYQAKGSGRNRVCKQLMPMCDQSYRKHRSP